jgi:hypothetical protein
MPLEVARKDDLIVLQAPLHQEWELQSGAHGGTNGEE